MQTLYNSGKGAAGVAQWVQSQPHSTCSVQQVKKGAAGAKFGWKKDANTEELHKQRKPNESGNCA